MTQNNTWKFQKYFRYKDALRTALPGYELPVELILIFRIAMPKSWPKKKRELKNGTYHDQKPDTDNLAKAFMDTFKGPSGGDDKHVADLHVCKFWSEQGSIEINYNPAAGSPF